MQLIENVRELRNLVRQIAQYNEQIAHGVPVKYPCLAMIKDAHGNSHDCYLQFIYQEDIQPLVDSLSKGKQE
jgi:hypothetical protein